MIKIGPMLRLACRTYNLSIWRTKIDLQEHSSINLRALLANQVSFRKLCTSLDSQQYLSPLEDALTLERSSFLSKVLRCTEIDAQEIIKNNIYILVKNKEMMEKKAHFLLSHFKFEDIKTHSELLTLSIGPIEQHYHIMKEFGFKEISCSPLLDYRKLIRKAPTELQELGDLEETCDPIQEALSVLSDPEFTKMMNQEFSYEHYMSIPLLTMHNILLSKYLAYRFHTSLQEGKFLLELHLELAGRSLSHVKECFVILAVVYNFSVEKIRLNPFLLHVDPSHLHAVAALPSLMGGDPIQMANKFPKVISKNLKNILEIEAILREHGVSDEDLQTSRYLFTLTPETVKDLIIKRKLKKMLGR